MGAFSLTRELALAGCLILAACATPASEAPAPAPNPAAAPESSPPERSEPPREQAAADRCGANDLQYLCTTCPMTRDYREDRQTILFDYQSGLVTSVACN